MKALIKHELRNIWGMILYFIVCFGIGVGLFYEYMTDNYIYYLTEGYRYNVDFNLLNGIAKLNGSYIVVIGLGLVVLLYLQFKDNKSIKVSSFIKSLPYTNQQIYRVKLGCGLMSFTVPFMVGMISILMIASQAKGWMNIMKQISPIGEVIATHNDLKTLVMYGLLLYSLTLMVYTLGFWMQYVINPNVASIIVSVCGLIAIPFTSFAISGYIEIMFEQLKGVSGVFNRLGNALFIPNYLDRYHAGYEIIFDKIGKESFRIHNLVDTTGIGKQILFMGLMSCIFILAIELCNQSYLAENQERFVNRKWAQGILKIGVVMSCMSIVLMLSNFYSHRLAEGIQRFVLINGTMMIGGIIGYFIIHKICQIGQR